MGLCFLLPSDGAGASGGRAVDSFSQMSLTINPAFRDAAWLPDSSSMVVAAEGDWTLRYNSATSNFTDISPKGSLGTFNFNAVAVFGGTGDALVVGSDGRAYTITKSNSIMPVNTGNTSELRSVSCHPGGAYAYIVGDNGTILHFSASTRQVTTMDALSLDGYGIVTTANMSFSKIAFRPGGSYALLIGDNRVFRIDDAMIDDVTSLFSPGILTQRPIDIDWCPDGTKAIVTTGDKVAYLWNATSPTSVTQLIGSTGAKLPAVAWRNNTAAYLPLEANPTSVYLFSGLPNLQQIQDLGEPFTVISANWRPDGKEGFIFLKSGSQYYVFSQSGTATVPDPVVTVGAVGQTNAALHWSWGGSYSVNHYELFWSNVNATLLNTTPTNVGTATSYNLNSLNSSTTYYAAVRVYYVAGNPQTRTSAVVTFTTTAGPTVPSPSTPTFSGTNSSQTWAFWNWSAGTSGESLDHYLLFASTSASNITTTTPYNLYTNISGRYYNLDPSTTYYIMVRVVTKTNRTADSQVSSFTTTARPTPGPVTLTVENNRYLEWNMQSSSNVTERILCYSTTSGSSIDSMQVLYRAAESASLGNPSLDTNRYIPPLKEKTQYYFRVRVYNAERAYTDSNEVPLKMGTYIPPDPASTGLTVTKVTFNTVSVKWIKITTTSNFRAYVFEMRKYSKTGDNPWVEVLRVLNQDQTTAVLDMVQPDSTYDFRLRVEDTRGNRFLESHAYNVKTPENIGYALVFGAPDDVPIFDMFIGIVLMSVGAGLAGGAATKAAGATPPGRGRRNVGAALGCVAASFFLLFITNILYTIDAAYLAFSVKLLLFILPMLIGGVVIGAVYSRRKGLEAREAAEYRRQQDAMAQDELRKKTESVKTVLIALDGRIKALDGMPRPPQTGPARAVLGNANVAFTSGYILQAEDSARQCDSLVSELEAGVKDKQTQTSDLQKKLGAVEGELKGLKEQLQTKNLEAELGIQMARLEPGPFQAARSRDEDGLQQVGAKVQATRDAMERDRFPEAREDAKTAEGMLEQLKTTRADWKSINGQLGGQRTRVDDASSWAAIDKVTYNGRIEKIQALLAYGQLAESKRNLADLKSDLDRLDDTYRPAISVEIPRKEYLKDKYEEFQFIIKNTGSALAKNIEVTLEAPADFGAEEKKSTVRVPYLKAATDKETKLNLCFLREGDVPVKVTLSYDDHAGKSIKPDQLKLSAVVVGQKSVAAPSPPVAAKGSVLLSARPILQEGFFVYKLAIINHSGLMITDVRIYISYKREVLRFHHISPPTLLDRFKYQEGEGDVEDMLVLNALDPKRDQEVTAELFFHPYICTETVIDAEMRYRDYQGTKISVPCEAKRFPCYCPTFGSIDVPNPAMVISFYEGAGMKESRVEPITSGVSLTTAFEVLRSALASSGLVQVGKERGKKAPYHAEALFYGEEDDPSGKGKKLRYAVIGMVTEKATSGKGVEVGGIAEIHIGCESKTRMTALLATVAEKFNQALEKQANIKRPVYVDMRSYQTVIKDSILYKSVIGSGEAAGTTEISGSVVSRSALSGQVHVEDSVVSRTPAAETPPIPPPEGDIPKGAQEYHEAYRTSKFNDGFIDEKERAYLNMVAKERRLDLEVMRAIELRVDREYEAHKGAKMKSTGKFCSNCGKQTSLGDSLCMNCGELLK